jgi:hypothetical protein
MQRHSCVFVKKSGGGFPGVLYSCRDFQKFPLPRRLCKKSPANAK